MIDFRAVCINKCVQVIVYEPFTGQVYLGLVLIRQAKLNGENDAYLAIQINSKCICFKQNKQVRQSYQKEWM